MLFPGHCTHRREAALRSGLRPKTTVDRSAKLATWAALDGKRPDRVYLAFLAIQTGTTRGRDPVTHPDRLSE